MSATNKKLSDLIADVDEGRLTVRPFFQRRLVWTNTDKESLIDTVLQNYPFPEIFVATGALDLKTSKRVVWLIDGQQRITTLRSYIHGSTDLLYKRVPRFAQLAPDQQTHFYDYDVAVRDLGTVTEETIREIFRRINSTDYALKSMEILNAMFSGEYKKYCEALSRSPFFEIHGTFSPAVKKRMYDVTFCVILVTTLLAGYYRRDEFNAEYLERYNDEFLQQDEIQAGLDRVFDFIESCDFTPRCRVWKQTDLFTVIVEFYSALISRRQEYDPKLVGKTLQAFFDEVDDLFAASSTLDSAAQSQNVMRYLKAATKATNDKYARVERAEIISGLLTSTTSAPRIVLKTSASNAAVAPSRTNVPRKRAPKKRSKPPR